MRSEKQTRREIIDKKLLKSGWNINDTSQVITEFDIFLDSGLTIKEPVTPYRGHQFSDYVLLGRDSKPLAVIEAKKTSVDAKKGQEQAKQYCEKISKKYGIEKPFCFFTNGYDTFFWNLSNDIPVKIFGFPTREDLERLNYLRKNRKPLTTEFINTSIIGRDYQIKAVRSIIELLEQKNKRNFLLVMATGTGKTRTCIALVDSLMRAGWIQRTLFLVDRIALREQALEVFKEFMPNEPIWPKFGEKSISKNRRVYVSTYPGMLNIIRDEENPLSPHFFDLVIVDESHRSIYNTYLEILNYFNTIRLGLTATPTDAIDHNTFELFDCDDEVPTFAYTYEQAVNNIPPYLSDFQVLRIKTRFHEEGINQRTISLEDQKKLILEGKDVEEINYEGSDLEKRVTNKGTNALIVKEFMEESIKDPNGVLPGKTIFFCVSKAHARRIEDIFNKLYPEYNGELARVIVSEDPRVYGKDGLLSQFKNNNLPRIAISVDMLDTGIDIREIVNLVFAKPVFSYTKFWQMIGRGTRLLDQEKIKSWCPQKDVFLIIDCWDNFEYFKLSPKGKEIKQQIALPVKLFGLHLDKLEKAIELNLKELKEKEINKIQSLIDNLPQNSVVVMDKLSELSPLENESFWVKLNPDKIKFLKTTVKPLMRTISSADFQAMRFEKELLELSLAGLLNDTDKFETLRDSIIEKISELPLSVNIVAREEELIREAKKISFWNDFNEEKLDNIIEKLAPLTKFIETFSIQLSPEQLNLKDMIYKKENIEFGPKNESVSIEKYKEMVEQRILDLLEINPILKKIKEGGTISEEEADLLARELHNERPYITVDFLRRVYDNQKAKFIQFIRHILGIETLEAFPETVSKEFESFIQNHSYLNSRQLQFLELLKSYLIENGNLQKKDLIQAPFTIYHPKGIRGVFSPQEINEILALANKLVA